MRLSNRVTIAVLVATLAACSSGSAHTVRSSVGTANPLHPTTPAPLRSDPPTGRASADGGEVIERSIASSNGFRPRPAFVYVPPVLRRHPDSRVPVLELLHGTPGAPIQWLTTGGLRASADAFARAHHGLAPLVVVPDINGARGADSECIRTASGADVERYLTHDVVRWVRTRYARAVGTARWWVAGLSEGGLCAAVLTLRHPDLYSAFGDLSGILAPRVEHVTLAQSRQQLYGGSVTAEQEHEPLWLLQHRRYADLHAWFICGASDRRTRPAQTKLAAAARSAHIPTSASFLPGRHTWTVWSTGLRELLPWFWAAQPH